MDMSACALSQKAKKGVGMFTRNRGLTESFEHSYPIIAIKESVDGELRQTLEWIWNPSNHHQM